MCHRLSIYDPLHPYRFPLLDDELMFDILEAACALSRGFPAQHYLRASRCWLLVSFCGRITVVRMVYRNRMYQMVSEFLR